MTADSYLGKDSEMKLKQKAYLVFLDKNPPPCQIKNVYSSELINAFGKSYN